MRNRAAPLTLALCLTVACESGDPDSLVRAVGETPHLHSKRPAPHPMSSLGQLARRAARRIGRGSLLARPLDGDERFHDDDEGGGPGKLEDGGELPGGGQGELAIAIDDTGRNVVIGFNDFRGFLAATPGKRLSVSGFMFSHDGGKTFVDGGQLPVAADDPESQLPQVFGDPDVKYLGGCNFIYTSIVLAPFGEEGAAAQTMGFHRSRDCGETWEGPFEIPPATNPNGLLFEGQPLD